MSDQSRPPRTPLSEQELAQIKGMLRTLGIILLFVIGASLVMMILMTVFG